MLIDTSFLYALYNADDRYHERSLALLEHQNRPALVPQIVLPEIGFLFLRDGGYSTLIRFLNEFSQTRTQLIPVIMEDVQRTAEIATIYASAEFDIVDCCIMALSERLNITQVCTFDRRDFSIFRPRHCDHLELLP